MSNTHMGAKEGAPSPMPASARSGATECDESCRTYTGDPHNQGGRYPAPRAATPQQSASSAATNVTHGRMGKQ